MAIKLEPLDLSPEQEAEIKNLQTLIDNQKEMFGLQKEIVAALAKIVGKVNFLEEVLKRTEGAPQSLAFDPETIKSLYEIKLLGDTFLSCLEAWNSRNSPK